jgi:integrase
MPTIKISRRAVSAIGRVDKPTIFFDTDLKGFGLLVRPSGARSWIIEYRPGAGGRAVAKRRLVLGSPQTLTPEQAREAARTMLARVAHGEDPAADRSRERKAETVAELAQAFMSRHVATKRKGSTAAFYQHILDTHVLPALGTKQAIKVTHADLARLHHRLGDKFTVEALKDRRGRKMGTKARGGPFIANRLLAVTAAMYAWGIKAGLENPAVGIEKFEERARERFLTKAEIDRLGTALREAETVGLPWQVDETKATAKHLPGAEKRRIVFSPHVTAAFRLLMFTGCRLREILHLEWRHVDLERGVLFLPDSKTGKKTIVLAAPALGVLATLPRIGRYVIASESAGTKDETPRHDLKRPWAQLCKAADLEGLRIHDLRHTFASFGACSDTHKRVQLNAMHILRLIRSDEPQI